VAPIITSAPTRFSAERNAMEIPTPDIDCTSVCRW
jgi:hypothetical protein